MASRLKAKAPTEVKPGHVKGVIFGQEKSGKTWLALSFPNAYMIDSEGGARLAHYMARLDASGGSYLGPEDGACDFDTILEQIKALATEKHEYKTLVIDSITKVFQTRIAKASVELGDDDVFGASKKPAIAKMRQIIAWILRLDMNVWFIAHESAKWAGNGKERKQVGVMADVWEKVPYELDVVLHVEKHSRGYRTATVDASRLLGFPEFERFDLQKNGIDVGYENFAARYGKDFIEAASEPIVLATPEQVAEIERMLSIVKIDAETIEKWNTKARAETWADFNTEQAAAVLKFLNAKLEK